MDNEKLKNDISDVVNSLSNEQQEEYKLKFISDFFNSLSNEKQNQKQEKDDYTKLDAKEFAKKIDKRDRERRFEKLSMEIKLFYELVTNRPSKDLKLLEEEHIMVLESEKDKIKETIEEINKIKDDVIYGKMEAETGLRILYYKLKCNTDNKEDLLFMYTNGNTEKASAGKFLFTHLITLWHTLIQSYCENAITEIKNIFNISNKDYDKTTNNIPAGVDDQNLKKVKAEYPQFEKDYQKLKDIKAIKEIVNDNTLFLEWSEKYGVTALAHYFASQVDTKNGEVSWINVQKLFNEKNLSQKKNRTSNKYDKLIFDLESQDL